MKKASLILNVVLVLAVGVLYYLHFSGNSNKTVGSTDISGNESGQILYINTDTVVMNYEFTKDKTKFIEENNIQREQLIRNKNAAYENAVRSYQNGARLMTDRERATKEEQIMNMQNELMNLQQQFQQDAMLDEQALLSSIVDTLENFMKDYTKGKNVEYVLGYQKNGTVFYRNPDNDITADVVKQLNSRYKSSNPEPASASEDQKKGKK